MIAEPDGVPQRRQREQRDRAQCQNGRDGIADIGPVPTSIRAAGTPRSPANSVMTAPLAVPRGKFQVRTSGSSTVLMDRLWPKVLILWPSLFMAGYAQVVASDPSTSR
ncbi:hypothetical protein [Nocardia sp. NPDC046763]|uniref:hypothetical protein n=1 Tax=Nocardia sp. NPDC046763 TaxID=3155256 RepID=UPI0033D26C8E